MKLKKRVLLSAKIGFGASAAIFIAQKLGLEYATSAGIIAMLTVITTKWETIKLSLLRLMTCIISVVFCCVIFAIIPNMWIEYGVFLFLLVFLGEWMGWRSAMSANAVIGSHFLVSQKFTMEFIINEILLVVIGIVVAILLNLIHINGIHEQGIVQSMRHVESEMKNILNGLACYLENKSDGDDVWENLIKLEKELEEYLELAFEYQNNTFHSHPEYYINYFEMRIKQCGALCNLHSEMRRMRNMPKQAQIVAEYIEDIAQYLNEINHPKKQIYQLEKLLVEFRNEPLPKSREEFENRAELYHVLMDMEEFLLYKKRFVEEIDETQFRIYWKRKIERF